MSGDVQSELYMKALVAKARRTGSRRQLLAQAVAEAERRLAAGEVLDRDMRGALKTDVTRAELTLADLPNDVGFADLESEPFYSEGSHWHVLPGRLGRYACSSPEDIELARAMGYDVPDACELA